MSLRGFPAADPAGWYTGPRQLYPDEPHFATVAQIEGARPWSVNAGLRAGCFARPPSAGVNHASRPATPESLASTQHASSDRSLLIGLERETTWIALPGSLRFPARGVPGPGSRKGRGQGAYSSFTPPRLSSFGSIAPLSQSASASSLTPTSPVLVRTYGMSSPADIASTTASARSLRLDHLAAQRRERQALMTTSSSCATLRTPFQRRGSPGAVLPSVTSAALHR